MILVAILVFFGLLFVAVAELAGWSVYGRFIPEEKLDAYFQKYLYSYQINEISKDAPMLYAPELPYLSARQPFQILSRWTMRDSGRIPKWSKWSKLLDAYYETLLADNPIAVKKVKGIDKYLKKEKTNE